MHPWSTNISTQTHDVHRIGFESSGALELDNEYSGEETAGSWRHRFVSSNGAMGI